MPHPDGTTAWSRRALLCAGCSTVVVGCGRSGSAPLPTKADLPGDGPPSEGATSDSGVDSGRADGSENVDCETIPGNSADGWVAVSLDDHPELRTPNGWVWIADPDALLYLLVVCTAPGCWSAVWSTCTHGACQVEWDAAAAEVMCPCHGSRFDLDGQVLHGPATRPLSAYQVGERDGQLWVRRA